MASHPQPPERRVTKDHAHGERVKAGIERNSRTWRAAIPARARKRLQKPETRAAIAASLRVDRETYPQEWQRIYTDYLALIGSIDAFHNIGKKTPRA